MQGKLNKHWLSGKGVVAGGAAGGATVGGAQRGSVSGASGTQQGATATRHLPGQTQTQTSLQERPFQRHLAMNLENDMYYTVDFSENSQHSPLIQ